MADIYSKENIELLFLKFLKKETSETENEFLYNWINESRENSRIFSEYKSTWDYLELSEQVVGISSINDLKTVKLKIRKKQIGRILKVITWSASAVAAAIILALFVFNLNFENGAAKQIAAEYVTRIVIPNGEIKQLILQDGSKVWINAGSSVSYNSWEKSAEREVFLDGEAYFEIARDTAKPFIVKTKNINIQVLGTKFNVASYANSDIVETTVVDGCVSVFDKEKSLQNKGIDITLTKNDQATYILDSKSFLISEVEAGNYKQWKDGILIFKGKRFSEIAKTLERYFDVKIDIKDYILENYTFTATFERGGDVDDILDVFMLTYPFSYEKHGKTITIKNKNMTH